MVGRLSIGHIFNDILTNPRVAEFSEAQPKGLTKRTVRTYVLHATGHISKRTYPLGTLDAKVLRTVSGEILGGDVQ